MSKKVFGKGSLPARLYFTFAAFFASSIIFAQNPSGYTLAKTNLSISADGTMTYQWVASNPTAIQDEFLIIGTSPQHVEVQSVVELGNATPSISPLLPSAGPATFVIGPFPIAAGGSVTFSVKETQGGTNPDVTSDGFILVPASRLTAAQFSALSLSSTPGSTGQALVRSAVAAPNISRNGQPVDFFVNLSSPGKINLTLLTLAGEKLFNTQVDGNAGSNTITWNLENDSHSRAASGLYLYYLQVTGPDGGHETRLGKIVLLN